MSSGYDASQQTAPSLSSAVISSISQEQIPAVADGVTAKPPSLSAFAPDQEKLDNLIEAATAQPPTIGSMEHGTGYSETTGAAVYNSLGQPPTVGSMEHGTGNSETIGAAVYNSLGQPPTVGSMEHGTGNSQTNGRDSYDSLRRLPPSRNDVGPRETSKTGEATATQNITPQEYRQRALTGKNLLKYLPKSYYMDEED